MALTGKKILVTGGTGFLGSALVKRLSDEGVQVRVVARRPERAGALQNLSGVEFTQGDISDAERMHEVVRGCEIVFHVAASTGGSITHQRSVNTIGARNVAQATAGAGVKRLVHVSTVAVYGYGVNGDVTEDTALNPGEDPYNVTKAEAEGVLREIAAEHRLPYSIIRPGMIYGPRSGMWTGKLFQVARMRPTPFVGKGDGYTFPIYVDDVVDLMLVVAEHPDAVGEAFNCTPDPSPTWREFLSEYAKLTGHQRWLSIPPALLKPFVGLAGAIAKPNSQLKELPNMLQMTQAHVTFKTTKARERLGWQPKVDLRTGVENCAPWLRKKGWLK